MAGVKVTKGKAPLLPLAVQILSYRDELSSDPESVGCSDAESTLAFVQCLPLYSTIYIKNDLCLNNGGRQ